MLLHNLLFHSFYDPNWDDENDIEPPNDSVDPPNHHLNRAERLSERKK
jgi:hypothetical protein